MKNWEYINIWLLGFVESILLCKRVLLIFNVWYSFTQIHIDSPSWVVCVCLNVQNWLYSLKICISWIYTILYFHSKMCMLNLYNFMHFFKNYVCRMYNILYIYWKIKCIEYTNLYIIFENLCTLNKQNWVHSLKNVNIEWTKLLTFFENFCTLHIHNFVQLLKNCIHWMYKIVYNH